LWRIWLECLEEGPASVCVKFGRMPAVLAGQKGLIG
jgi:hypothetical protein